MPKTENRGRTVLICLAFIACATLGGALSGLYAANNTPPSGWLMVNRDRARWAMGQDYAFKAVCSATNTLPATGLAVGDVVWGAINLSDPTEDQSALTTTLTIAANSLTSSATPWTAGEHYVVFVHRTQASDR